MAEARDGDEAGGPAEPDVGGAPWRALTLCLYTPTPVDTASSDLTNLKLLALAPVECSTLFELVLQRGVPHAQAGTDPVFRPTEHILDKSAFKVQQYPEFRWVQGLATQSLRDLLLQQAGGAPPGPWRGPGSASSTATAAECSTATAAGAATVSGAVVLGGGLGTHPRQPRSRQTIYFQALFWKLCCVAMPVTALEICTLLFLAGTSAAAADSGPATVMQLLGWTHPRPQLVTLAYALRGADPRPQRMFPHLSPHPRLHPRHITTLPGQRHSPFPPPADHWTGGLAVSNGDTGPHSSDSVLCTGGPGMLPDAVRQPEAAVDTADTSDIVHTALG